MRTDFMQHLARWAKTIHEGRASEARNEIFFELDRSNRNEEEYIGLAQLLMDIGEYHHALCEISHVLQESSSERWRNSAHIYNAYGLKRIGEWFLENKEEEAARGHFLPALFEVERGLGGSAHAQAHFFGIAYKAQLHYLLGEYDKVIETPNGRGLLPIKSAPPKVQSVVYDLVDLAKEKLADGQQGK